MKARARKRSPFDGADPARIKKYKSVSRPGLEAIDALNLGWHRRTQRVGGAVGVGRGSKAERLAGFGVREASGFTGWGRPFCSVLA